MPITILKEHYRYKVNPSTLKPYKMSQTIAFQAPWHAHCMQGYGWHDYFFPKPFLHSVNRLDANYSIWECSGYFFFILTVLHETPEIQIFTELYSRLVTKADFWMPVDFSVMPSLYYLSVLQARNHPCMILCMEFPSFSQVKRSYHDKLENI